MLDFLIDVFVTGGTGPWLLIAVPASFIFAGLAWLFTPKDRR